MRLIAQVGIPGWVILWVCLSVLVIPGYASQCGLVSPFCTTVGYSPFCTTVGYSLLLDPWVIPSC